MSDKGKRIFAISFVAILLVAALIPIWYAALQSSTQIDFSKARKIRSEKHLKQVLATPEQNWWDAGRLNGTGGVSEDSATTAESAPSPGSGSSSTNIQVAGMDEGDIVKNDGDYIYRLSNDGLTIVRTKNGNVTLVSQKQYENFSPFEIYVLDTRLVVVGGRYTSDPNFGFDQIMGDGFSRYSLYHRSVEIRIYDITDKANLVLKNYFQIDGDYYTSRLALGNGVLYFVVNYYNYSYSFYDTETESSSHSKRPFLRYSLDDTMQPMALSDIYYFAKNPSKSYMVLGKIDILGENLNAQVKAYLSSSHIIYISGQNLYLSTQEIRIDGNSWLPAARVETHITRFSLSMLSFTGSTYVEGTMRDRFFMDEYNGYFRVAVTYGSFTFDAEGGNTFASAVYSFDSNLKIISSIKNIAPGETLDSVTFSGSFGYISTSPVGVMFDPLYTIDFTNPANITISEGLSQEGINSYLKNIDGTNYVIGIGIDSNANGARIGLKLEFYDMTPTQTPESLFKYTFDGTWSHTDALFNPHAILYMYDETTKKGLVGFAVETVTSLPITVTDRWGTRTINATTITKQGFHLFEFSTKTGTMEEYGFISNFPDTEYVYQYNYYQDWSFASFIERRNQYITRAVVNNGYLYTIADGKIAGYNLDTLVKLGEYAG